MAELNSDETKDQQRAGSTRPDEEKLTILYERRQSSEPEPAAVVVAPERACPYAP